MPKRRASPAAAISIDLVLIARVGRDFEICLTRPARGSRAEWHLPSRGPRADETLDSGALAMAVDMLGREPGLLRQARAAITPAHAGHSLSVVYLGLTSQASALPPDQNAEWVPLSRLPRLDPADREAVDIARGEMRRRMDQEPVAFALLPEQFTLSELQSVYELLLGHRLHKASFRRALLAAELVHATDEWRSEARGRPAQLFRYAPKRKRRARRALRFDLLGD